MRRRKDRQHFENIDHGMEKDRKKGGKKTERELRGRRSVVIDLINVEIE